MLRIIHGSDLHFGKPHDASAASAFARDLEERPADLIVLSGDFTQRAKIQEFEAASAFIERFSDRPVVVTPGNHDVPLYRVFERLLSPYRNYTRFISPELDTVTRVPGAIVVALDSTSAHRTVVNGRLTRSQLAFARTAFERSAPDDTKILVTHHNMALPPDYRPEPSIPGKGAILRELERMGVELILSGHVHRAYVSTSLNVVPHDDRTHGILIAHSGTTTSTRGRAREKGRNTYNRVQIAEEHMAVEHYIYDRETDRFGLMARIVVPRRNHPELHVRERADSAPHQIEDEPVNGLPDS